MSILSSLAKVVRSLTSDKANTDVSPGGRLPPPEQGSVPRPDREPVVGFEPDRED